MKHFLPFLVLATIARPFSLAVNVSSNEELTYYLCEAPIQDTLDLYLNSSLQYELHPPINHFCYINVTRFITISSSEVTNILCNSARPAVGFVFHNISVNIVNITFVHCGNKLHYLSSKTRNYINSTRLFYSPDHGVALLFIECNITTNNLQLIKSFGFAIIGYNIYNSSFSKSEFRGVNTSIGGSGMLLHFIPSLFHRFINIEHSLFIENVEWLHTHFDPDYYMHHNETRPINNAAGLTVIYMNTSTVRVKLQNTNFAKNSGLIANALLILAHNSSRSYTDIENCNFSFSTSAKSVLKFYESSVDSHNSLTVSNTVFCNHHHLKYTVWISSNNSQVFYFENTTFCNNSNNVSTVYVTSFNPPAKCSVHFKNVSAFRNSAHTGVFYFNTIKIIKISGSSNNFSMNYCPVVYAHHSNLVIDGHATFSNNSGDHGGALKLVNTYLYFYNNSNVSFIGNKAHEIGGAIYIYVTPQIGVVPWCAITFSGSPIVTFSSNTAVFSANAIFAYPIYHCKLNKTYVVHKSSYIKNYVNMMVESISNDLYNISSNAKSIERCGCTSPIEAYPGEMVTVSVKAMDAVGNFVFSAVTVSVFSKASSSEWKVPLIDYYQVIEESKNGNCTHINFTIISSCDTSCCKGAVSITSAFFSYFHQIPVNLLHCPIGFDNKGGICVCGSAINKFNQHNVKHVKISCFISNQTILGKGILTSMWIGEDNNSLALSQTCPIGYCNLYYGENWIRVLKNNTFVLVSDVSLNDTRPLCMANRMGKLCGQCVNGTSVVFGSTECMKCSDYYWILTSAVYIISGPLVICILFALRLTLTTGTINGIIFYAQAANCGILEFLTIYKPASTFPIVFISLLSLDLGYPMCFYNGMTELWKAYIQLLFPFYLLSILVVLIVLSHFSHRISNVISRSSVQVLVTIVHLSFSKLLFAIIDVFSYTELYSNSTEKSIVWLWDASINYWSSDHIKLMLFTSLIVSIVLLPYLFLLFTGRLISRYRIGDTLRPFYEAIHGPYKENRKYWFVARLILLMIMCILFAVFRGVGSVYLPLMTSGLLMTFIVIQAYIRPFKSTAINILDLIIMLDVVLTYSLGWYIGFVSSLRHSLTVYWLFLITFAVVFVLFLVVLIGHIVWITGKYTYIKECFHRNRNQLNVLSHNRSQIRTLDDASDSFYGSCRYREPVLDT